MLSTILFRIVKPNCRLDSGSKTCSVLLTTLNNVGSTTLFNPVFNNLQQLVIFTRVYKTRHALTIENSEIAVIGMSLTEPASAVRLSSNRSGSTACP